MSGLRVAIVGAGKRVLETALPSLRAAGEPLALEGIYARSAREVESSGATVEVRPLDELLARGLDGVDLIYLAVGKDAVPGVLASLAALRPTRTDLLIETPVVRFRHWLALYEALGKVRWHCTQSRGMFGASDYGIYHTKRQKLS